MWTNKVTWEEERLDGIGNRKRAKWKKYKDRSSDWSEWKTDSRCYTTEWKTGSRCYTTKWKTENKVITEQHKRKHTKKRNRKTEIKIERQTDTCIKCTSHERKKCTLQNLLNVYFLLRRLRTMLFLWIFEAKLSNAFFNVQSESEIFKLFVNCYFVLSSVFFLFVHFFRHL